MSKDINFSDGQTFEINFTDEQITINEIDGINVYSEGSLIHQASHALDFYAGSNVTLSVTKVGRKTKISIASSGGGGGGGGGTGDVVGPSSATDGNFPLFNGATGKIIKNSAYSPSSFDAAGAAAAAQAASQPLDSDLTAIAALATTAYGRALLTLANAAAADWLVKSNNLSDVSTPATARTNLGLAIGSNVQAWDADLDAIAALSTTSYGRALLTLANAASADFLVKSSNLSDLASAATARTNLGLESITYLTGGDISTTSASLSDATGLSFAVTSGTYYFDFFITYTAAAAATGSWWSVNTGATTTNIGAHILQTANSAAMSTGTIASLDGGAANTTSNANLNIARVTGIITVTSSGTVILRYATEVAASAITIKGSSMSWVKYYKVA